jgi:hypothetical protein
MSSATAPPLSRIDRASEWLNPILVKESRQSLKSRQFVATFFLMLTASWLISVFGVVVEGAGAEYREIGRTFFFNYYIVLAVAVFVVVPFSAFRSLLSERDLHTWEVLSITTLKPREIVWGKLSSALLQIFIYYSAITPFMAFAKLLKGIDAVSIALVLVASLVGSMMLSLIALTAGTFGNQRYWQIFMTLGMLIALLNAFGASLALVNGVLEAPFELDSAAFWWVAGVIASFVAAYGILFLQIAVGQLTFDADNRTTGVRLAAAGIFWLAVAWLAAWLQWHSYFGTSTIGSNEINEALSILATLAAIQWGLLGLITATETDPLSRRVRRGQSRFLIVRLLRTPLMPGGARGYLYIILHLAALAIFVVAAMSFSFSNNEATCNYVLGLCCYVAFYLGLGSAVARLARRVFGDFRPAHARVLTLLLVALGSILPQTLYFFEAFRTASRPQYWITDPFHTLGNLASGNTHSTMLIMLLAGGTAVVVLLNIPSILAAFGEVTRNPASPDAFEKK